MSYANSNEFPETVIKPTSGWAGLNLGELWKYRELVFFLTWRDIKVRYKQTSLGVVWAILQPVLTMIVFTVIFGKFGKIPSGNLPYPIVTFAALLPWQMFSAAINESGNSLVTNQRLVTKVYFPRMAVPMGSILASLVDFVIAFLILGLMMVYYGIVPGAAIVFVPLFLILSLVSSFGVGLWLSALNVEYRDVRYVIPFLTQIWMFMTPIAYSTSLIPEEFHLLYSLNPMVSVIEGFRWAILGSPMPSASMFLASCSTAVILFVTGIFYFRRMERTFADRI